jgi:hypothetical protein
VLSQHPDSALNEETNVNRGTIGAFKVLVAGAVDLQEELGGSFSLKKELIEGRKV